MPSAPLHLRVYAAAVFASRGGGDSSALSADLLPLNHLQHSIHVLEIPPHVDQFHASCGRIGMHLSMEPYFTEFLSTESKLTVPTWHHADFIWVPQCVSLVYWQLKSETGMDHRAALSAAERRYLRPIVEWVTRHPAHDRFHGANFFTVYSAGLGRQDFPSLLGLTRNWTIAAEAGRPSWLEDRMPWLTSQGQPHRDCLEDISGRVVLRQDVVIPVPSKFRPEEQARVFERSRRVFFSGSLNSCARQHLHSLLHRMPKEDILIADHDLDDTEYRSAMHNSKYCLVLKGALNTNSAQLYDAIVHGCVPVIISDDFHAPLELQLQWESFAIFLGTSSLPELVGILENISEEARLKYFQKLVLDGDSALMILDWQQKLFWISIFRQAGIHMHRHKLEINPGWWESAFQLRATALELYMQFLDRIDCPRHVCTALDVAAGIFGCADAETLMPAIASVYRRLVMEGQIRMRKRRIDCPRPVCTALDVVAGIFGCADAETLALAVASVYRRLVMKGQITLRGNNPVFVDGGANTGKLTYKILASLGELFARRLLHDQPETEGRVSCPLTADHHKVTVISVEPSAKNFRQLESMAEQQLWSLEDWIGFNGALADYDGNGSLSIEPDWSLDEVATLQPPAGDSRERQAVEVVTLPTLRDRFFKDREIVLLKLDVEGAELAALRGAREMLLARQIGFIVFEYSRSTWRDRLVEMVRYLFSVGYVCFLVTERDLFPVSGFLWDDAYEKIIWSNFLCVAIDNTALPSLMSAYIGNDARTSNIVRALHELYS